jgi:amino acid transporter
MIVLVSVIGLLFDLPVVIAYGMFSAVMPRSGGDYVYISRTFLPSLGFAASLVFWPYGLTFAGGQNAYFTVTFGLTPYLCAIGAITGSAALVALSQAISQPIPLIGIGTVMLLLILFALMLIPTSVLHRILFWSFIVAFLGYPILFVGQWRWPRTDSSLQLQHILRGNHRQRQTGGRGSRTRLVRRDTGGSPPRIRNASGAKLGSLCG